MSLSQQASGEMDAVFAQQYAGDELNYYGTGYSENDQGNDSISLNYTAAVDVLDQKNIEHHMTPRYEQCPHNFTVQISADEGKITYDDKKELCFKFIDTDREKEIDLGTSWPFAKLNPYECIVPSEFASKGLSVGSKIRF